MGKKLGITIVGPGRLGSALACSLRHAGYSIDELVSRDAPASLGRARKLAQQLGSTAIAFSRAALSADVIWICVGDSAIRTCSEALANRDGLTLKGKIVVHSSAALSSHELGCLRDRGASVASVHPMMSFVHSSKPSLEGVTFALEGDQRAVRLARRIAHDLKAESISLSRQNKSLYHVWGGFASPLMIAELATADFIARKLRLSPLKARKTLAPILRQTIENYIALGPAAAFSGPFVRGDVETVRKHLKALKQVPQARQVYLTLARAALQRLPVANRVEIQRLVGETE